MFADLLLNNTFIFLCFVVLSVLSIWDFFDRRQIEIKETVVEESDPFKLIKN